MTEGKLKSECLWQINDGPVLEGSLLDQAEVSLWGEKIILQILLLVLPLLYGLINTLSFNGC